MSSEVKNITELVGATHDSENESYQKFDIHEAILFTIELSSGMFQKMEELGGNVQLVEILETLKELMAQLVIVRPGTGIGCYIHYCDNEDSKNGIYELLPLRDINIRHMKKLNDLLDDFKKGRLDPYSFFNYEAKKMSSLENLFTFLQDRSLDDIPNQKSYNNTRIFLFTDNDKPTESNDREGKKRLRRIVDDLDDQYVNFVPFFIGSEEKPFDSSFYSDILKIDAKPYKAEFDGPNVTPISVSIIKSRVLQRKELKRTLFTCPLILDQDKKFVVGMRGYNILSHEKPGTRYKLVYEDKNIRYEAHSSRKYLNPVTGETIAPEKLLKIFAIGDLNLGMLDDKMFKFKEENLDYDAFLKIIGFRSNELCLKYYNNIDKTTFVVPDEKQFEGSIKTFASLYRTMRAKDKCMLLWGKIKTNSNPTLYILSPSQENDSNEGFYFWKLPFIDEVRKAPTLASYETLDSSTSYSNLNKVTENIISHLNLKNGYRPSEYKNPGLQRHFKILHDYILQVEAPDENEDASKNIDEDDTLQKVANVRQNILTSANSEDHDTQQLHKYMKLWNKLYSKASDESELVIDKMSSSHVKKPKYEINL